jgi:hypothetical protein
MAHRWWNRTDWNSSKWEAAVAEVSHAPDWRGAQSGESDWVDWGESGHWLPQNTWSTVARAAVAGPSLTPSVPEALGSIAEVESPLADLLNALSFEEHHIHEPSPASYYANDKTCRGTTAVAGLAVCPSSSSSSNDAIAPMPMQVCPVNDASENTGTAMLLPADIGLHAGRDGSYASSFTSDSNPSTAWSLVASPPILPMQVAAVQQIPSTLAVAGPNRPILYVGDLRVFGVNDFIAIEVTDHYRQHSAALKYFRKISEAAVADPMQAAPMVFAPSSTFMDIQKIDHPKGMDYCFLAETVKWHWTELIAQMDMESKIFVCRGPEKRSSGVTHCSFEIRPNSYDHKRMHANRSSGVTPVVEGAFDGKLPVWDFVIHRDDDTGIRLHPGWSSPKIESYDIAGHTDPVEPPKRGFGKSDGRGTYKHYKDGGNQYTLRFDPWKKVHKHI